MKKLISAVIFVFILIFIIPNPVNAASDTLSSQYKSIHIHMTLNSPKMTINGQETTSEEPILINNSIMVPLRVISNAFGIQTTWYSSTNSIELSYWYTRITLKVNSKEAIVNDKKVSMPVAPIIRHNTMLIPLRFIANYYSIQTVYIAKTHELLINGETLNHVNEINNPHKINFEQQRIGNSTYEWSVQQIPGLKTSLNTPGDETWTILKDKNDKFKLDISIDSSKRFPSKMSMMSDLTRMNMVEDKMNGNTIFERFVDNGVNSYAQSLQHFGEKGYEETRIYTYKKYSYVLTMYVKDTNYDSKNAKPYEDFLDSFTGSFEKDSSRYTDITQINNGKYHYKMYGAAFEFPVGWNVDEYYENTVKMNNKDKSEQIVLSVTPVVSDQTLEQWSRDKINEFNNIFLSNYFKVKDQSDVKISGYPSKKIHYSYTLNTKDWVDVYSIFTIADNYRYHITFLSTDGKDSTIALNDLLDSLTLKPSMVDPDTFYDYTNQIEQPLNILQDQIKKNKSAAIDTINFNKYKLLIKMPADWNYIENSKLDDEDGLSFDIHYNLGKTSFFSTTNYSLDEIKKSTDQYISKSKTANINDFKFLNKRETNLFGTKTTVYDYEHTMKLADSDYPKTPIPVHVTEYEFSKNNINYDIQIITFKVSETDYNKNQIQNVLQSIEFKSVPIKPIDKSLIEKYIQSLLNQ